MPPANPSLTPIGRLANTSDRVSNLRGRVDALSARAALSPHLRRDVDEVRQLLGSIDRAINDAVDRVLALIRAGDEMSEQAKRVAYELVLDQDPWINYVDARLDAANIAYLALDRAA